MASSATVGQTFPPAGRRLYAATLLSAFRGWRLRNYEAAKTETELFFSADDAVTAAGNPFPVSCSRRPVQAVVAVI